MAIGTSLIFVGLIIGSYIIGGAILAGLKLAQLVSAVCSDTRHRQRMLPSFVFRPHRFGKGRQ